MAVADLKDGERNMIEAYPLGWPVGWKRTPVAERKRAKFSKVTWSEGAGRAVQRELSIDEGTRRILAELARMGAERESIIISTNLKLRLDGLPLSKQSQPVDVGVAVYWTDPQGKFPHCMAIDIYDRIADNLGAVAASIEALRLIERHGGAQILERAFAGFAALPAPGQIRVPGWRDVLEISSSNPERGEVRSAYRRLRSKYHPDRPQGDAQHFDEIQNAWEQACAEMGIAP